MRTRLVPLLTAMIATVVMASGALAAEGARGEEGRRGRAPQLTPEQRAVVEQARELQKDTRIARLELALAEAKDAPEQEIARRAEDVYRLQGKARALRSKHPQAFRMQRRHQARQGERRGDLRGLMPREGARRGHGIGPGRGQQMGPQGPRGGPGMGQGMRRGMGPGTHPRMGQHMQEGMGPRGPRMRGLASPDTDLHRGLGKGPAAMEGSCPHAAGGSCPHAAEESAK